MTFEQLGLSPEILKAVDDAGYSVPTPIQKDAIPIILQGRDVLGCAQTGTGKTASFTLPMIEILSAGRARARMPRSLILIPTRELAQQIAANFETYGKYHSLTMALLIGGVSPVEQGKVLQRGVDVLIATPGRLIDLFERGAILLSGVKVLVVDEADRMLDMGFIPDVEKIIKLLPPMRQTLMFSATMPPEIRRLADAFLSSPKEITVSPPASPAANVVQRLVRVGARDKSRRLRDLIDREKVENALIFCNRKKDVDLLHRSLNRHGYACAALHGDMDQPSRTKTIGQFKAGEIAILVATDVAGRGLDVAGLSHVFNYDVPFNAEDYVHRIGRTGRAGRQGRALTLATADERKLVVAIEALIGKAIPLDSDHEADAAPVPAEATGEAAAREGDAGAAAKDPSPPKKPRRARQTRRKDNGKADAAEAERPARANSQPKSKQPAKAKANADKAAKSGSGTKARDGDKVVGLGDHVPAFLRNPVRIPC